MPRTRWLATLALAIQLQATAARDAIAHGIVIGRSAAGEIHVHVEEEMPVQLPPSVFPGIDGWAGTDPGLTSVEVEEPDHDLFFLDPGCFIRFILVSQDPGIQVFGGLQPLSPGDTIDFGPPFFDFHLVFNIHDDTNGPTFAVQFRFIDLNGIHADSDIVEVTFTPGMAECHCPADVNDDHALSGDDVQSFVTCWLETPSGEPAAPECLCADVDADGHLDDGDVAMFVDRLLGSEPCE
jgi:hypothetical protein